MNYKLNRPSKRHSNGAGYITKNGHTLMQFDIVQDLKRKEFLELENASLKKEIKKLDEWLDNKIKKLSEGKK